MDSTELRQRLAAILAADVAGYSRLMSANERATVAALDAARGIFKFQIESNHGRVIDMAGDSVLAVFETASGAVSAALSIQRELATNDCDVADERRMRFRIGVHLGDVIEKADGTVYGDGVNIAARLEGLAEPGGISVSDAVQGAVRGRVPVTFLDRGEHRVKNIPHPVRMFSIRTGDSQPGPQGPRSMSAAVGNLPHQATSFHGREEDISNVSAMLKRSRLVTLTGVGGVGKTRLALRTAAALSQEFPDGTWIVELAAVGDPAATGHAVSAVLGVAQQPGKTIEQSVVESLVNRRLMLVVDNCEHLIDAAATLLHKIITQCPLVSVLATSREALMVDGEQIWPVPSLGFRGGADSPAVALFADRARAVTPDFTMDNDVEDVVDICRQLDGIPLAIELAAARIRVMRPAQIRERLDERFRLLTGGSRRALERHQTLRHAVQWSYDLLSEPERLVLLRCTAFAGGFSLEAAEQLCSGPEIGKSEVLDLLDQLVRKSLMTIDRSGELVRYGLLETIRQFAEEKLIASGESEAVRARHARFFADDSSKAFETWLSPRQADAYAWLDREMDNLRAAFRWAVEHQDIDIASSIASNLGDMARFRMRDEAVHWPLEIVDAARQARHRRLALVLTWIASNEWGIFGRLDSAINYAKEACVVADTPGYDQFVWCYTDHAMAAALKGNADESLASARAGAAHPADSRDRFCMSVLGTYLALSGRHDEAMAIADEAVAAAEATGIPASIAAAYWSKGRAFGQSEPAIAIAAFEMAAITARHSGNRLWEMLVVSDLAVLQARAGEPRLALDGFRQLLESWGTLPDLMIVLHGIEGLIVLFERLRLAEPVAVLYGMFKSTFPSHAKLNELSDLVRQPRARLGESAFDALEARGARMPIHEIAKFSLECIAHAISSQESNTVPS